MNRKGTTMGEQREPKRAGSTLIARRPPVRLGGPRTPRAEPRNPAAALRLDERMPNGDPPCVTLWGEEE